MPNKVHFSSSKPLFLLSQGKDFLLLKPHYSLAFVVKENAIPSHPNQELHPQVSQRLLDEPTNLPPLWNIQHQIDLIPGSTLPNLPHYGMSSNEYTFHIEIRKLLDKGHIQPSLSSYAVLTLLAPKKDGSRRLYIGSQAINKTTIKYRFPSPGLPDLLDQLGGASIFSKIDLRSGYHQIRIWLGDKRKTTFKTN